MPSPSRWPRTAAQRPVFGRDRLVDDVLLALGETRLVTLVGDVGMGKATVAKQVLARLAEAGGSPYDVALLDLSVARVGGARTIDDLLAAEGGGGADRVIAIGQHPLGLPGERVLRVGRLDDGAAHDLFRYAVRELGRADVLDAASPDDVAALSRLLEGWPLAIELAARRTTLQSVPEVLTALRAGSMLHTLDRPALSPHEETAPAIRTVVAAGLAGLGDAERSLAGALAGFVDWCTLPEIVTGTRGSAATLPALEGLVGHHVVDVDDSGPETFFRLRRPYREALADPVAVQRGNGPAALGARHAAVCGQAEAAVDALIACSSDEETATRWYGVLRRRERDLRAVAWHLLGQEEREQVLAGAIVALALSMYAAECSELAADDGLLDRAITSLEGLHAPWVALMLEAYRLRRRFEAVDPTVDTDRLAADLQAAVSAAEALGDERVVLECLAQSVGSARTIGHLDQAQRHAEQGVALATTTERPRALAFFELLSAMVAHAQGRFADAAAAAVRAHLRSRRLGLPRQAAQSALVFHQLPPGTPNVPRLRPSLHEIALLLDGLPAERSTLGLGYGVAAECLAAGDLGGAARATSTGLRVSVALGEPASAGIGIMIAVVLAAGSGDAATAARLHGALDAELTVLAHGISPGQRALYDGSVGAVIEVLGDDRFALECGRGAAWTWPGTVDAAIRLTESVAASPASIATAPGPHLVADHPDTAKLTPRELEVLALLAAGMSNKEISELLCLAPKTTMHHTSNIYRRLGVRGRGQAAAWARQVGIG